MKWIKTSDRYPTVTGWYNVQQLIDGEIFTEGVMFGVGEEWLWKERKIVAWLEEEDSADEIEIKGQYTMWKEVLSSFLTEYTSEYKSFTMDDAIAMMRKKYFIYLRPN